MIRETESERQPTETKLMRAIDKLVFVGFPLFLLGALAYSIIPGCTPRGEASVGNRTLPYDEIVQKYDSNNDGSLERDEMKELFRDYELREREVFL